MQIKNDTFQKNHLVSTTYHNFADDLQQPQKGILQEDGVEYGLKRQAARLSIRAASPLHIQIAVRDKLDLGVGDAVHAFHAWAKRPSEPGAYPA